MSASAASAYTSLSTHFSRIGQLRAAAGILGWDAAAMMPEGAAGARAEQSAALEVTIHEKLVDPRVGDWIAAARQDNALDHWQRANLHEIERDYIHATAVPADLVETLSIAATECEVAWRSARANDDFKGLLPKLNQVLTLVREQAQAKAARLGCTPYDALLDLYEPGGSSARIDALFDEMSGFLPGLIDAVIEKQAGQPILPFDGRFPLDKQEALGRKVMAAMGFDFTQGRLDVSAHPFCGGAPGDVRLTTRYTEDDFFSALMGVIHETGHALYEMNLPAAWRYQPVGLARGMTLHESQSLLMEKQVGHSLEFLGFLTPLAREVFGGSGPAWAPENVARLANKVERSFIRVEADEVTYPAHIVLRYRLERALIAGDLALADLPGAWRDGMLSLIGRAPDTDREGCLQDIHWPSGAWGYFPTYTLGAMAAAQFYAAAIKAEPGIPAALARGDFTPLLGWLRQNVHGLGSSASTDDILTRATGAPLGVAAFRAHLESRYLG